MSFSEYSSSWIQEFEQTRSSLFMSTEGWLTQIEHFGSTAVPGCIAAPVVDVLAGLSNMTGLNQAAMMIEGLNFRRLPSPNWCDEEVVAYLEKPRSGNPTHTVLLVSQQSRIWRMSLAIRERLLRDWSCRDNLMNLKRDRSFDDPQSLELYQLEKANFFSELSKDLSF